ncbi:AAA family ATPase [bacterium]|nr:AAA family ATPase [bacterium]
MIINSIVLKNFLIIPDAQIDLCKGLNVVTGETGSGKSLFVSAIKLIRGHRGVKSLIGKWSKKCEVSAVIQVETIDVELKEYLDYLSIDTDEYDRIIIRRIIGAKNICYINHVPVNKSVLEKLMCSYIEISSQFENQLLFRKSYQIQILDNSAIKGNQLKDYQKKYFSLVELEKKLTTLKESDDQARRDYLEFQINEIIFLKIIKNEEIQLHEQIKLIENKQKIIMLSNEIEKNLESASNSIYSAENYADQLKEIITFDSEQERISSLTIEIQDLQQSVGSIYSSLDECSDEKTALERYDAINTLLMKHNVSDSCALLAKLEVMKTEISDLEEIPKLISELEKKYQSLLKEANELAETIHGLRLSKVHALEKQIMTYLNKFGMDGVTFKSRISKNTRLDEFGLTSVKFLVNAVGGTELYPIKTLSGGELSRLLLTLKLINKDSGKFILFDEIDSNIGGETAVIAAAELKKSSINNQILVVTHFPQTAGAGDNHLVVERFPENSEISSSLVKVEGKDRLKELARMMGNSKSKEHIKAAEKLLNPHIA